MLDQEPGLRGYRLTADNQFLEPYSRGRAQVAQVESHLESKVDQGARKSVRTAEQAAAAWQTWSDSEVGLIQTRRAPVDDAGASVEGKRLFDNFRSATAQLEGDTALRLAAACADAAARSADLVRLTVAIAGLSAVVLVALGFFFFHSTLRPMRRLFKSAASLAAGEDIEIPDLKRDDEVGELARSLAAWQRVTVERLTMARGLSEVSGRIELSEVLDPELLCRVSELLESDQLVLSLVSADGVCVVAGCPAVDEGVMSEESPATLAVRDSELIMGDLAAPDWGDEMRRGSERAGLGPVMAIPMVSGGETIGAVTVARTAGRSPFTDVDAERAAALISPLSGAVRISRLFDQLRSVNEELERTGLQTRSILESAGEGIYGLDSDGRCTFVNTAAATTLGYEPREMLGSDLHSLVHHTRADGSHYPIAECPTSVVLASGASCRRDTEVMWPSDGTSFPVEYAAFPIVDGGG
ncbi:MAG: CHASE3 domain-containing protein [Candidatus Dormibacteria bacterium]